ncbi:MAG: hypothetical protein H0T66_02105 [Geodermatophilaceae bacterium]|nr:hypothetical protein [Geodermatophilaceae bacterium]MDQ3456390.1 hypothetical protein [Actinomycetota bacterium]
MSETYREGRAGWVLKLSRDLTVTGTATALAGRSRRTGVVAATLLNAGAAALRYGIFEAGMASARDPKYTVVPQLERLAAR